MGIIETIIVAAIGVGGYIAFLWNNGRKKKK